MTEELFIVAGLLLAGYVLLAIELFLIPGFGFVGIGGCLCLAAGCWLSLRWFGVALGLLAAGGVLASITGIAYWFPRSRHGKGVINSSSLAAAEAPKVNVVAGEIGVAESDLRPAGIARFGEVRESVVTDGEFLEHGTRVRVIQIEGARVVVEVASGSVPSADAAEN